MPAEINQFGLGFPLLLLCLLISFVQYDYINTVVRYHIQEDDGSLESNHPQKNKFFFSRLNENVLKGIARFSALCFSALLYYRPSVVAVFFRAYSKISLQKWQYLENLLYLCSKVFD